MIGNGRVHRLLGTRRKVKIFRRKRSPHRTVLSLTREFAPSSRRTATNRASWAHLTVESYDRIVKDSSCVHWKIEEDNSDRWLAFQNRKRDDRLNQKHTHRSRFSPAMPRTSFPDNLWKSPLLDVEWEARAVCSSEGAFTHVGLLCIHHCPVRQKAYRDSTDDYQVCVIVVTIRRWADVGCG